MEATYTNHTALEDKVQWSKTYFVQESTLRQLESRADAEEKRWQEKLQSVQKELEKVQSLF